MIYRLCKNAKFGGQIGRTVGEVLEYDVQPDGQVWGSALWMLIEINVTTPLARGRTVNLQGPRSSFLGTNYL